MGLTQAKDYIKNLRERQANPYLWPDYLTGLPDKAAILQKLDETYPKLGSYSIAYIRIANVNPFLVKYGAHKHADIVQWAAAILKTVADEHGRKNFVGTLKTHDFILMARTDRTEPILKKANSLFSRQIRKFYGQGDIQRGYVVSYRRQKAEIKIGLMKLIYIMTSSPLGMSQTSLLLNMEQFCNDLEDSGSPSLVLEPEYLGQIS